MKHYRVETTKGPRFVEAEWAAVDSGNLLFGSREGAGLGATNATAAFSPGQWAFFEACAPEAEAEFKAQQEREAKEFAAAMGQLKAATAHS